MALWEMEVSKARALPRSLFFCFVLMGEMWALSYRSLPAAAKLSSTKVIHWPSGTGNPYKPFFPSAMVSLHSNRKLSQLVLSLPCGFQRLSSSMAASTFTL